MRHVLRGGQILFSSHRHLLNATRNRMNPPMVVYLWMPYLRSHARIAYGSWLAILDTYLTWTRARGSFIISQRTCGCSTLHNYTRRQSSGSRLSSDEQPRHSATARFFHQGIRERAFPYRDPTLGNPLHGPASSDVGAAVRFISHAALP